MSCLKTICKTNTNQSNNNSSNNLSFPLQAPNGTATNPSYSFEESKSTGIYSPAANQLALSAGNTNIAGFSNIAAQYLVNNYHIDGNVGFPSISFSSNPQSGIYYESKSSPESLNISINNSEKLSIDTDKIIVSTNQMILPKGSASVPSYTFDEVAFNTGMFSSGENYLDFSTGGTTKMQLHFSGMTVSPPILASNGTSSAPAYSFSSETDTGMYKPSGSNTGISFTINTDEKFRITSNGIRSENAADCGEPGVPWPSIFATLSVGSGDNVEWASINNEIVKVVSDERLKKDIQDIPVDWARFNQIRPVSYRYKSQQDLENEFKLDSNNDFYLNYNMTGDDRIQIGMIAQEMNTIYPWFVNQGSDNIAYSIKYDKLISILIKQVQDLHQRVKELEGKKSEEDSIQINLSNESFGKLDNVENSLIKQKRLEKIQLKRELEEEDIPSKEEIIEIER